MNAAATPRIWTLTDERAGNFFQADALARAIGNVEHHLRLRFPPPWRWTAPRVTTGALAQLPLPDDATWPDIAIGCGRQSALALRVLRRASSQHTFCVQILDPRIDAGEFDLVVTPQHDELSGSNVINTIGALNAVSDDWLRSARLAMPALAQLPRPLTSVMIGGPHRDATMDSGDLDLLEQQLRALQQREGGSFLLCASRRTPPQWQSRLRALGQALDARTWIDARDGANPYRSGLACADRIVVSADSVNMLSEACAVGVNVISYASTPPQGKLGAFDALLRQHELLSDFDTAPRAQKPLRETANVADIALKNWQQSRLR